ncbi:hypothetical protein D3C83_214860 [compost metagenome]
MCLATWIAKLATPPAPPWTRIVSPAFNFNVSSIETSAVSPISASEAHSTCVSFSGFFATIAALIATFSA